MLTEHRSSGDAEGRRLPFLSWFYCPNTETKGMVGQQLVFTAVMLTALSAFSIHLHQAPKSTRRLQQTSVKPGRRRRKAWKSCSLMLMNEGASAALLSNL